MHASFKKHFGYRRYHAGSVFEIRFKYRAFLELAEIYPDITIDDVKDLDEEVDYAFLPINGVGNNMNAKDAADFAYEVGAKRAVPLHYGLFDSIDPADFDFENALILTPYEETEL